MREIRRRKWVLWFEWWDFCGEKMAGRVVQLGVVEGREGDGDGGLLRSASKPGVNLPRELRQWQRQRQWNE